MGTFSIWHWLIVLMVVLLLFGRGKISDLMGDVAKGIKSFKKGIAEDDEEETAEPVKSIEHDETEPVKTSKSAGKAKAKAS